MLNISGLKSELKVEEDSLACLKKETLRKTTRRRLALRMGVSIRRALRLQILESPVNKAYKQAGFFFFFSHNKSGGGWHCFRDKINSTSLVLWLFYHGHIMAALLQLKYLHSRPEDRGGKH